MPGTFPDSPKKQSATHNKSHDNMPKKKRDTPEKRVHTTADLPNKKRFPAYDMLLDVSSTKKRATFEKKVLSVGPSQWRPIEHTETSKWFEQRIDAIEAEMRSEGHWATLRGDAAQTNGNSV